MRTARGSSHPRGGLPQCMLEYTPPGRGPGDPPGCGSETPLGMDLEIPPGVGLETPLARPLNFPPGCGPGDPPTPETCKACWDITCKACWDTNLPPQQTCCKACLDTTSNACWDTTPPPPVNRMTDRYKTITLPQTSFAGGKYDLNLDLLTSDKTDGAISKGYSVHFLGWKWIVLNFCNSVVSPVGHGYGKMSIQNDFLRMCRSSSQDNTV